jgi:hypothetical protein
MLIGSLVTAAWRVLRLKMEKMAYQISSRGEPIRDGPPLGILVLELTKIDCKK